jgi:hypothetical protein
MQALFGAFGPSATLDVALSNTEGRLTLKSDTDAAAGSGGAAPAPQAAVQYVYSSFDNVDGEARVIVPAGKKLEHIGIRAEVKGVVGESNLSTACALKRCWTQFVPTYRLLITCSPA